MESTDQQTINTQLAKTLKIDLSCTTILTVNRAASALVAILRSWKTEPYIVALPSAVCHDVLTAVLAARCQPFFCDIDPQTGLTADSEWLRAKQAGAQAAIVVHLYGNIANTPKIRTLFPAPDYLVIDDAAQALGSHTESYTTGTCGDVGLLSFNETKQISTGGAALLIHNPALSPNIASTLKALPVYAQHERDQACSQFRHQLEDARKHLRKHNTPRLFQQLLTAYQPALFPPIQHTHSDALIHALSSLKQISVNRQKKYQLWQTLLQDSSLQPLTVTGVANPWRFSCRLPGIGFDTQHLIAERIRHYGIHVSHWYLPAHWFVNHKLKLHGTEQLAREIFQFWIDEHTTLADIQIGAKTIKQVLSQAPSIATTL